ncbi:unnamed protein product, partial [marine sediment metagenome]
MSDSQSNSSSGSKRKRKNPDDPEETPQLSKVKKADPNLGNKKGDTPLLLAIKDKNIELIYDLVVSGAKSSEVLVDKMPILWWLVGISFLGYQRQERKMRDKLVNILISYKANSNLKNENGETILMLASKLNKVEGVKRHLNLGVDPNEQDNCGNTALIWASCKGCVEIVQLLLEAGTDPNLQSKSGETALIWAIKTKKMGVVKVLLG